MFNEVCVIVGKSESGDNYGPWVFNTRPEMKELEAFLRENACYEFADEEGPGIFNSYLHIKIYPNVSINYLPR